MALPHGTAPVARRLLLPSVILNVGGLVAVGVGMLFHLMAARGLGTAGYGAFTASLAYVTLWAVVMEGGIGLALTREASAHPERLAWAPRMALWRAWLGLVGATGAVVSAWLLHFDAQVIGLVAIMAVGMVAMSAMRFAFAVFRAVGWFSWEAAATALQKAILVPLTAVALLLAPGPVAVAAVFTLSMAIAAAVAVARAWHAVGSVRASPPDTARPPTGFFLRTCGPLLLIELLTNLYFRSDQVMLLQLRGPEETGLYAAGYRVVEALLFVVGGTMTVLFPRLAHAARTAPMAFRADFIRAWRALWVGGLLLAVNGWLWAVAWFPAVFGRAYAPAEASLHVLLGAIPLAYVNYLLTQSLVARGHERAYAAIAGGCVAVNLTLNVFLIPRWGATGAAWATVLTEGALLVGCTIGLRELVRIIPLVATLATGAGAALAVVAGWWLLAESPWGRGVLALGVSVACWEAVAPWPMATRWARSGVRAS